MIAAPSPAGTLLLLVHHAPDADDLVAALAEALRAPQSDVLATEQVAVHSRGLERWLAQRLSHRLGADDHEDGISIAVDFPFPGRLARRALAQAVDPQLDPAHDPWRPERLVWHLLDLVHTCPQVARDTPLAAHLQPVDDGGEPARRFPALARVAQLFDHYAVHRPRLLRGWIEGDPAASVDGRGLPATHRWQPRLWRILRDHVVQRTGVTSPAERLEQAVQRLTDDPGSTDLPDRVSVFGLTALPTSHLDVLAALGVHRDVHLFVLHPSPSLWERALERVAATPTGAPPARDADPLRELPRHPLLRAWGRDARELQVVLAAAGLALPAEPVAHAGPADDTHAWSDSALHRLQADIRTDTPPTGPPLDAASDDRPQLAADDRSLTLHSCHGRSRQVEVLRDLLLHAFASDPSLEPRDVLVLCPDLDAFAPLLGGVFGVGDDGGAQQADGRLTPRDLRVRLADRATSWTNPLLRVTHDLLLLADGRVGASDVLDLLARPPVRTAFGLDDRALERVGGWIDALGVRWGFGEEHRRTGGVPTAAGTWRRALERLLIGAAVSDEQLRTVGGVVPFDDVPSGDLDLLGRFAELLERLERACTALNEPRPIDGWAATLLDAVRSVTATSEQDRWQQLQLERILDEVVTAATPPGAAACDVELHLAELRALLRDHLEAATGSTHHRTGDLTVSTMMPMRCVPHRVIVLLGMDDGALPRTTRSDGDDLLELDPHVGDRDPRSEDRQLLLDALLAARERLVVLYSGHDERSNEPRPPAVCIGELLDTLDRTLRAPPGTQPSTRPSGHLTTVHPLRATDPRNFLPGELGVPDQPFASDPADLAGAAAVIVRERPPRPPFLAEPLEAPDDGGLVELSDLIRTVVAPVQTLLAERLGLRFPPEREPGDDELPLELQGLRLWHVGDRMLHAVLDGHPRDRALEVEHARDALPQGGLAESGLERVESDLDAILALVTTFELSGPSDEPTQVEVPIAGDRRLLGAVDELLGATVRRVGYSALKERDRLAAWIRVLALSAAHPATPWRAITVGRAHHRKKNEMVASASVIGPIAEDADERGRLAREHLARLVAVRDLALTCPLPVATVTSARYAEMLLEARQPGSKIRRPESTAANAWDANGRIPRESEEPAHVIVQGGCVSFRSLLDEEPAADESAPPWDLDVPSRFGRWALHLWAPLLANERLEHR